MKRILFFGFWIMTASALIDSSLHSQPPGGFGFGPGGPGMRGPGGPNRAERKLLKKFDANKSGWLESDERAKAREAITSEADSNERRGGPDFGGPGGPGFDGPGFGGPGFGGPGGQGRGPGRGPGGGRSMSPPERGKTVSPDDVQIYLESPLYDTGVVRTLFLKFDNDDWD